MILEFIGGIFDSDKKSVRKKIPPPFILFTKPVLTDEATGQVTVDMYKYTLESVNTDQNNATTAKYIITEQRQEVQPYETVFPNLK